MREKLQKLMQDQGLTSSKLAEILEIQPSGISHLMAGRNKPGFDLLQRILRRFPQINPDWLLLDSDQMYREQYTPKSDLAVAANDSMDTDRNSGTHQPAEELHDLFSRPNTANNSSMTNAPAGFLAETSETRHADLNLPSVSQANSQIERIVIFYNDHTFECFDAHTKERNC